MTDWTVPQRRLPRAERRESIIDAAEELFAEGGYAGTRWEDVAAASEVSKQLLQRHFATKRDLLLAVLVRHRDGLLGRLAAPGGAENLEQRLRLRLDRWFSYVEDHPAAARLLFSDVSGDPEIATFYTEMRGAARTAVADLLRAEHGLAVPEARLTPVAEMLRSGTVGLAVWWSENRVLPRDQIVEIAVEVWTGRLWGDLDDGSSPSR